MAFSTGVDSRMMAARPRFDTSILATAKSCDGRVGDAGQKLMKILPHTGDQAHAGVEACDHKMAAISTRPARPNSVCARAVSTSAPVARPGYTVPVSAPAWPSMA